MRDDDGALRVASGRKPHLAPAVRSRIPILRGPIALAEAFALLPMVRRALPQAPFPFERPVVLGSIAATTLVARALRRSGLPTLGDLLTQRFAGVRCLLEAAADISFDGEHYENPPHFVVREGMPPAFLN